MIWYLVAGNGVKAIMNKGNEKMEEKKREITQEEQKVLQLVHVFRRKSEELWEFAN